MVISTAVVHDGGLAPQRTGCLAAQLGGVRVEKSERGSRRAGRIVVPRAPLAGDPAAVEPAGPETTGDDEAAEEDPEAARASRALERPPVSYPAEARRAGLEGTVWLRILVTTDGSIAIRSDPACEGWHEATEAERSALWHERLCIQVLSGPKQLHAATLEGWSAIGWDPLEEDGEPTYFWVKARTDYRLED